MAGHSSGEPRLCWVGQIAQKIGCLPTKRVTNTAVSYPITVRHVDSHYGYSDDVEYKPGPRLPPPRPDEPKPLRTSSVVGYQHKSPRIPKSPKKTPVAQTIPLSTLPLQVNTLPINHTPYLGPPSSIPHTPRQNVPDSVLQELGNISPTQYIWNTPHGALTYTPAPASHLPLPNPLADLDPCSPCIVNAGAGNDGSVGLGLIPSSISSDSSDSSSDCPNSDHRTVFALSPFLASTRLVSDETMIEWDVSEPAYMARHVLDNASFLEYAGTPATDPPTNTLCIDFSFVGQPEVRWNWEPISVRKRRPIRIADVLHAIHEYFQLQLTHPEYDIIKSHGKRNARIVANSWRNRVASQPDPEVQSRVYHGGLRRVDCLGSSKIFAGLWADGSKLRLGLRV